MIKLFFKNQKLFLLTGIVAGVMMFLSVSTASADYYAQGVLASGNVLSGADVSTISSFQVIANIPAGTTVKVKFSQDRVNYYSSTGVKEGWDNCTNGTTAINISGLGWTGGLLFYKLQLTTTDVALTPTVSQIQVDYDGTVVPPVSGTTYYGQGILASKNMLSGADATAINGFQVVADIPAGTTVNVKFSQDNVNFYNSAGEKEGWDSCVDGTTNINLSGLGWSGGLLFYKLKLGAVIDNALTPTITDVQVDYDGTAGPLPGGPYYAEATMVSTDLLGGTGGELTGDKYFTYAISSLPSGTNVYAQFSTNGTNWYNSSGTLWGWDTLTIGNHMNYDAAINLQNLNWQGAVSFYYKLRLTSTVDDTVTPVVSDVGFLSRSVIVNSPDLPPESKITLNASQADKMTNGLVGIWSFDGPDVNIATNTATDRSSGVHNGTITDATQAIGKNGQALDFNGTTSHVSCGNVGSGIKTIAFWMKADDITGRKIMDLDGTRQIEINSSSQVVATGFPAATIYVDGAIGSTVDSDWHHITITDTSGVNGSAVDLGRVTSGYFDGRLDEVRFYDRVFPASEVKDLYGLGHAKIKR